MVFGDILYTIYSWYMVLPLTPPTGDFLATEVKKNATSEGVRGRSYTRKISKNIFNTPPVWTFIG